MDAGDISDLVDSTNRLNLESKAQKKKKMKIKHDEKGRQYRQLLPSNQQEKKTRKRWSKPSASFLSTSKRFQITVRNRSMLRKKEDVEKRN